MALERKLRAMVGTMPTTNQSLSSLPPMVVLDESPLIAAGLAHYLQDLTASNAIGTASSAVQLAQRMDAAPTAVLVVVSARLGDTVHWAEFDQVLHARPQHSWLALGEADDSAYRAQTRLAGACQYVNKRCNPDALVQAIACIAREDSRFAHVAPSTSANAGQTPPPRPTNPLRPLTKRQSEVYAMAMRGLANKQIANHLCISESTVKEHMTQVLEKLGVKNRIEALAQTSAQHASGLAGAAYC